MNALEFERRFGRAPEKENDDLHRVTCDQAGIIGHLMCGICPVCDGLKFECGGQIGHMAQLAPEGRTIYGGIDIPAFWLDYFTVHGEVRFTITDHIVEGEEKLYRTVYMHALKEAMSAVMSKDHQQYLTNAICQHLYHLVEQGDLRRWGEGNWYYKERRQDAEASPT